MNKLNKISILNICPKCVFTEVSSWIEENSEELNAEVIEKILDELQKIKSSRGECIVCKNEAVSSKCLENVYDILQKSKTKKQMLSEFENSFGFIEDNL